MEPPKPPIQAFINDKTVSKNYPDEEKEWIDTQVSLDNEGFRLLASHYDLNIDDSEFYMKLSLYLARDHVNLFSMKNKVKKQSDKSKLDLALIAVETYMTMKAKGVNRAEAIREMAANMNVSTLKNHVPKGERLFGIEDGSEVLRSKSLEELQACKDELLNMKKEADEANARWYR